MPSSPEHDAYQEPSARYEFPKMLYNMLEDCTFDENYCKIVSWQPHGLAFKVHNREELEKILPKWFREKYESWRCLLEQWGFLKLSRGIDRGCWYHKRFYHKVNANHAKKHYENVEKEDFVESMPGYLSFRDEPNLEKESTLDNRISPKKRKIIQRISEEKEAKLKKISLQKKTDTGSNKDKPKWQTYTGKRYSFSTLKKCRYCHELFAAQGFSRHEEACRIATQSKSINESDSDDDDDSARNTLSESDEDEVQGDKNERHDDGTDNEDLVRSGCQICGFDDDHANLLLCEGCDTELHTYCLDPPLEKVPQGDWFCGTCELRIGKAKNEICGLIRKTPARMTERFGEICFAKSAENAHWWPALIFDPRSFLHNREVVELTRRNLGKRYLVFFFENQDAFAAIPKAWIMTWEEACDKGYDKGKSVRNASKSRKEQFEKAMDLANEAFEDASSGDSESSETTIGTDLEEDSIPSRIPRVIGETTTIFDLCPRFDWKALRTQVREEVDATDPSKYPKSVESRHGSIINHTQTGRSQAQVHINKKSLYLGLFEDRRKAAVTIDLFLKKLEEAKVAYKRDAKKTKTAEASSKPKASFGPFTDKKPIRSKYYSVAKAKRMAPVQFKPDISHFLTQKPPKQTPTQKIEKKLEPKEEKRDLQVEMKPLQPLSDNERDALLLDTAFCHYYLLPLSEL